MLVTSSLDGTLKYWDVFSSKLVYTHSNVSNTDITNSKGITTFSWSTDGKKICYGTVNGDIAMVSVTADKMVMESKWNAHHGKITSCIMVEDNLLSASVEDKTFRVWNINTTEEVLRKVGEPLHIALLANDQLGQNVMSGSMPPTVT